MLSALKSSYRRYYEYVAENVAFVEKHGYLRTAIVGRIRWFGFHPKPTEISNFPIQSGIADVMNTRTIELQKRLPKGVELVAQIHDACILDTPKAAVPRVKELIQETWAVPVVLKASVVCRNPCELVLPSEIKTGHRWSEL
jgi:DNA polymerase I-like protein with 3'-5' exonuclease and polymerase domains